MRKWVVILCGLVAMGATGQNWDKIRESGEYYYGIGVGKTVAEADVVALAELSSQIATHVSSDFTQIDDIANANGSTDHKSKVLNCVKTYSQSSLTNVERWVIGESPEVTVRRYMRRDELARIYDDRIKKAKDMVQIAEDALNRTKIDMALQYYYWAYSLIRSVQRPNEVTDDDGGHVLVNWLPIRIAEILDDVDVKFEKRDGDYVDLLFSYGGKPVSSLEFTYSDGRTECQGSAKDGRGMIEMVPGYATDVYHVNIEYEYKGQARGDVEMQSVLNVISRKVFKEAEFKVHSKATAKTKPQEKALAADSTGVNLKPSATQTVTDWKPYDSAIGDVLKSIGSRNYSGVTRYFTIDGLDTYNKLISYGKARIVGNPNIKYFKSANGNVVARGLQMSFTFNTGRKKTFVEDVVFTFDKEMKIDNIAFGLGQKAESDILCKYAPGWNDMTREMIMEFLENYKTAYCLKRYDYIKSIFSDDAVIIIGNVARRRTGNTLGDNREMSVGGKTVINYNRYTKDEYLKNLKRCFARNEFINIRFTNNDIQWLEKYEKEKIFAIQIGQEYCSSSYSDKGYLFLLVDMTDQEAPLIKIRTWQPNEVAMEKLYNAGDFYNE